MTLALRARAGPQHAAATEQGERRVLLVVGTRLFFRPLLFVYGWHGVNLPLRRRLQQLSALAATVRATTGEDAISLTLELRTSPLRDLLLQISSRLEGSHQFASSLLVKHWEAENGARREMHVLFGRLRRGRRSGRFIH